ncbi:hypothetical protein OEZ85_000824 [Tetradesmus obliquus]|uniref:PLP-dependent transferase n=1 Tax=Tetradesmus obliquus TaxID=3088 RepID=A0ABY8UMP4_TETOB|nr:hypothetical protein OEZ85_000824 [Tetradesmus obliquus]
MEPTTPHSSLPASNSSSSSSLLQLRQKHYGKNAALSYKEPLHIVRGQGCYLYDESGAEYLDCVNNVASVGHANPQVAAAVSSQLGCLYTNSRYLSSELTSYCQELTDTLPEPLQVAYLVNSGSEANDLALRIASAAAAQTHPNTSSSSSSNSSSSSTPRDHVVVMAGAYHGHLTSLIPLSPYKFWGKGGEGKADWVHVMPCPDPYRGTNLDGAAAARAVLAEAAAAGGRVVAFFCESIISCGGQVVLPPGYLAAVYAVMHEAGVVCIADEVQTGFARSGDVFWAFETQGVVPDIVTMGKPMGNGFPIGGLVTNHSLAAAFAAGGMEYFNTYGGNNAAVAAGRAVLQEIRQQGLQQRAADTGRYLQASLLSLQSRFPQLIGDVRGIGLFYGLDIVTCPVTKAPGPMFAGAIKEAAKAHRVLLSTDGPAENVIKIKPPLVFGRAEVDRLAAVLGEVLSELSAPDRWLSESRCWWIWCSSRSTTCLTLSK